MMKLLKTIKSNKSGASAAEYALMLAIVGGVVIGGMTFLGARIDASVRDAGADLDTSRQ